MDIDICISKRRDTRHFTNEVVPDDVIIKALNAAHSAPSVGLTEPWRFVIVKSDEKKRVIKDLFDKASLLASTKIVNKESRDLYQSLKLEAILETIGIAIFCDVSVLNDFTIGTIGNVNTLEWSCACAVQNLWLSLTAQGFGAGWVSILDYKMFNAAFDVPESWKPLGYMCVGKPSTDYNGQPMLQKEKWRNKSKSPVVKFV
jgi:5,6-dimethylbenzimidazole synthase